MKSEEFSADTDVQPQYKMAYDQTYQNQRPHSRRASCYISGAGGTMSGTVYVGPCPIASVTYYPDAGYHLTRDNGNAIDCYADTLAAAVAIAVDFIGRTLVA